jgi:hypothetical protein
MLRHDKRVASICQGFAAANPPVIPVVVKTLSYHRPSAFASVKRLASTRSNSPPQIMNSTEGRQDRGRPDQSQGRRPSWMRIADHDGKRAQDLQKRARLAPHAGGEAALAGEQHRPSAGYKNQDVARENFDDQPARRRRHYGQRYIHCAQKKLVDDRVEVGPYLSRHTEMTGKRPVDDVG